MAPKKDAFGTAQEWLKRAKGNLARAKQPKPKEAFWDDLCFAAGCRRGYFQEGRSASERTSQSRRLCFENMGKYWRAVF
jgi:hypothetical protein